MKHKRKNAAPKLYFCYVIKMHNTKFYVGITRFIFKRLNQHTTRIGSTFVAENMPFQFFCYEKLESENMKQACKYETQKAFELILRYGIENVYGGSFTGPLEKRKAYFKSYKKRAL